MTAYKALALIVVAVVVISLVAAAYELGAWNDRDVAEVEGGAILEETSNEMTIRCLSPTVTLRTNEFSGRVTFSNGFPTAVLEGFDGEVSRNSTAVSFDASSDQEYRLVAPQEAQFSFAVMGDSQGHNDILAQALNMTQGCDFIIHCGDLTPSGSDSELDLAAATLDEAGIPVFTTPGNHEVKNHGILGYEARFGPSEYSFDYGGVRFAFVDSSQLSINNDQISWLERTLEGVDRKVIVTHAPCYDAIEGNHTLDSASCERLENFALSDNVTAVFSGHVHAYSLLRVENTDFVITGGAGGSLTEGTYHWVRVNVTTEAFEYEKVDINRTATLPTALTIKGHGLTVNLTMDELEALHEIEGDSSYQNQFGNIAGNGHYAGVNVSTLLSYVGDMSDGDVLRVTATDGYYQDFGFGNVYPNSSWLDLQGPMILATSFDGAQVPGWQDGPRIAMLPSDGLYNNSDCGNTSYPGQGYDIYPSAGARWVKNVVMLEVVT